MPLLSPNLEWSLANRIWAQALNPIIANPLNQMQIIQNFVLHSGNNTINHNLGRQMMGWFITDIQGASTLYRSAPLNDKTLTLNSSAAVTVSIGVF